MYLCLTARLATLVELRVLAELTGPEFSVEAKGPTLAGVSPRVGLLEVGGVLLLTKPGPRPGVLVGFRSLLWYILGPLNNPLDSPGDEACGSELVMVPGPAAADEGPAEDTEGPETSALSSPPNLKPGSSKIGYSKSMNPRSQGGMSGGGITVVVGAVGGGSGTWASSLNLLATSILDLLASNSCSSLLLRPGSLCPRASGYELFSNADHGEDEARGRRWSVCALELNSSTSR
jgi:hypothetical protein